ncbi:MAG TPA: hypothetical protein VFO60_09605 [Candidatus Dormibacteraeota bacterium]|nr:hypothetical protein [Candidatus Dormibacteraeota bacterium]
MFPRWFYALAGVELAGIAAVVLVGIHLLSDGSQAVGDVIAWAAPRVHTSGGMPSLNLPVPTVAPLPSSSARTPAQVIATGNGLLDTLNGSTRTVTLGQISLVDQLTRALRGYIERLVAAPPGHR